MANVHQALREERANIWEQMKAIMDNGRARGTASSRRGDPDLRPPREGPRRQGRRDHPRRGLRQARRGVRQGRPHRRRRPGRRPRPRRRAGEGLHRRLQPLPAQRHRRARPRRPEGAPRRLGRRPAERRRRRHRCRGRVHRAPGVPAEDHRAMTFVAAMRQLAEVITTDTGANLPWPTVDDTGNEGAILAENTQVSEQDVTFGQASLDAYMYTSKLVRLSLQLLNDNAFGLEGWLANALGASDRPRPEPPLHRRHRHRPARRHHHLASVGRDGRRRRRGDLRRAGRPDRLARPGLPQRRQLPLHDEPDGAQAAPQAQGQPEPAAVGALAPGRHPGHPHGLRAHAEQLHVGARPPA
jgi:hypothetical protein